MSGADYARENVCPKCHKATHCCKNCRFYSPGKHNDCDEPVAERVTDKDRANFCDYFEPSEKAGGTLDQTPDDLLKAAEDLFK